ncbi:metalloprotease [Flavobacteriaceae bacterium LMO-SS05]
MKFRLTLVFFACMLGMVYGQNRIDLKATFNVPNKTIAIAEEITYKNETKDTLKIIYLNDWNNSYSTKNTPLAKRFTQEYDSKFHFAKSVERGYTNITSIKDHLKNELDYSRTKEHPDVLKVTLANALLPGESYRISLTYNVLVPSAVFTSYGVTEQLEFNLKYWYITPAVYDGAWQYYSNLNLDDLYTPKADQTLVIEYPKNYKLVSELNLLNSTQNDSTQTAILNGTDRVSSDLSLLKSSNFKYTKTDYFTINTNIEDKGITGHEKALILDKIAAFIDKNLGSYPHDNLLLTEIEYKKDPLYGLNQLPDFIRPFPDHFQYELKLLKTALNSYLENTLLVNPRKDYWLKDGLQIYFLMKYVEENYPDMKLLGTFANTWGVRSFHAADLDFNSQYQLFFMQMARTNRDQPLTLSKDSLLKFNANIANKYKAGIGLKYLDDFVNANVLETTISEFLKRYQLKQTSSSEFETLLKQHTEKDVEWFFTDYLNTRKKIDFKIKDVIKTEDSVTLTIKNKRDNNAPVSLFALHNDSVLSKTWIENIKGSKTITIPKNEANKLALNYDNTIPEYNLRDNWKSLKGFFFNNRPLQFRVLKDFEDPYYNQVFFMPLVEFSNIYDGLTLGAKMYNKTVLRKRFIYKLAPQYGTKSNTITGRGQIYYTSDLENKNLYNIIAGFSGSYTSFATDAYVSIVSPNLTFNFRDDTNFRSNKIQSLNFRYLDITRTQKDQTIVLAEEPDYGVFNIRYLNANPGLVNYFRWDTDLQFSKSFGKFSFNYEYRKLSQRNRQFNFRFFAGAFLYNKTEADSDYFSFALDRPTDYLFDYEYLGRSETSGIFSQQLIIAEGGFKSKLDTPFANQWLTTINTSTTLWKYIQVYGDIGLVKNKYTNPAFVYDSGLRLDLVTDYFEIYFPIYSNLGWEIGQPLYDQKIRFKFTVDPKALLGLFRRKWY